MSITAGVGRMALLMPIVTALADRAGLTPDGRGRAGLALAVGCGTFSLSTSILPANVPNLAMAGAIEQVYHLRLAYLPYLLLHAPVLGLLKGAVLAVLICLLFPDRVQTQAALNAPRSFSIDEKRLAVILAVTLLLWVTDSLHGIPPAWVGLVAACVCLLPRVGFVTEDEFATGVNVRTLICIASILGLAAVVAGSGLGEVVERAVVAVAPLDPARPFVSFITLVGITVALSFVVTANGVPALYTPLAGALAQASGAAPPWGSDGAGDRLRHAVPSLPSFPDRGGDGVGWGADDRRCPPQPRPCARDLHLCCGSASLATNGRLFLRVGRPAPTRRARKGGS